MQLQLLNYFPIIATWQLPEQINVSLISLSAIVFVWRQNTEDI